MAEYMIAQPETVEIVATHADGSQQSWKMQSEKVTIVHEERRSQRWSGEQHAVEDYFEQRSVISTAWREVES